MTALISHWPRLAALGALALALAACGVKGPLEPPPAATAATATEPAKPEQRGPIMSRPKRPPPVARPDQPFVLDSLL